MNEVRKRRWRAKVSNCKNKKYFMEQAYIYDSKTGNTKNVGKKERLGAFFYDDEGNEIDFIPTLPESLLKDKDFHKFIAHYRERNSESFKEGLNDFGLNLGLNSFDEGEDTDLITYTMNRQSQNMDKPDMKSFFIIHLIFQT